MTTINKLLCMVIIIVPGCNTNGNHAVSNYNSDTSVRPADKVVTTDTLPAKDTAVRAKFSLVRVDNLDCPVCRKPLLNCLEDTTSFLGKTIGFDSRQCKTEFAKNPEVYKIEPKR